MLPMNCSFISRTTHITRLRSLRSSKNVTGYAKSFDSKYLRTLVELAKAVRKNNYMRLASLSMRSVRAP